MTHINTIMNNLRETVQNIFEDEGLTTIKDNKPSPMTKILDDNPQFDSEGTPLDPIVRWLEDIFWRRDEEGGYVIFEDYTYEKLSQSSKYGTPKSQFGPALMRRMLRILPEPKDRYLHDYFNKKEE